MIVMSKRLRKVMGCLLLASVGFMQFILSVNADNLTAKDVGSSVNACRLSATSNSGDSRSVLEVAQAASNVDTALPATFESYTSALSAKWAWDLVVAPKRAKDNQILHAYAINKLTKDELQVALETASERGVKMAILRSHNSVTSTNAKGYKPSSEIKFYATPIVGNINVLQRLSTGVTDTNFTDDERKKAVTCALAAIMARASFRASGVTEPSNILWEGVATFDSQYIGVSTRLDISAPTIPVIAQKSAWASLPLN